MAEGIVHPRVEGSRRMNKEKGKGVDGNFGFHATVSEMTSSGFIAKIPTEKSRLLLVKFGPRDRDAARNLQPNDKVTLKYTDRAAIPPKAELVSWSKSTGPVNQRDLKMPRLPAVTRVPVQCEYEPKLSLEEEYEESRNVGKAEFRKTDTYGLQASPMSAGISTGRAQLLPIQLHAAEIVTAMKTNQVVIISAETGSGKTTQIGQILDGSKSYRDGTIVITQPRRFPTISCARRVADEMKVSLGSTVGYAIRGDHRIARSTRIVFETEGVLLKQLEKDPLISSVSVVILDEAHELSVNMELLIGMLKKVCRCRPTFRMIVCSATADVQLFKKHLNGVSMTIPGRSYPVDIYNVIHPVSRGSVASAVFDALDHIASKNVEGDVLVFLPGSDDITTMCAMVREDRDRFPDIVPFAMYSALEEFEKEAAAVSPIPSGMRKVIFSTNICETSITIPTVTVVIDSGYEKAAWFNVEDHATNLNTQQISKSSAKQRAGRAGRVQPGVCFRLFTEEEFEKRHLHPVPELTRTNLESTCLQLHCMGSSFDVLDLIHYPPKRHVESAEEQLLTLGALDIDKINNGYVINATGRMMAKFPVSPSTAKFLLTGQDLQSEAETLSIAAILESEGLFHFPKNDDEARYRKRQLERDGGDVQTLLEIFDRFRQTPAAERRAFCNYFYLNLFECEKAEKLRAELGAMLVRGRPETTCGMDAVCIARSFARAHMRNSASLLYPESSEGPIWKMMIGNSHCKIHPSSFLFAAKQSDDSCVVAQKLLSSSSLFMLNVSPSKRRWLDEDCPKHYV